MPASHSAAATQRKSLLVLDLLGEGTGAVCSLGREEPSMLGLGCLAGEPTDLPCALRGAALMEGRLWESG